MTAPAAPFRQSVRMMALGLLAAPVFIGVAMAVVLRPDATHDGGAWWPALAVEAAAGAVAGALIELVGYRLRPLDPMLPADRVATAVREQYLGAMVRRVALAELPAFVAVALCFIAPTRSVLNYLLGGAVAVALMAIHVWPSARVIDRCTAALERGGARSGLADLLTG